MNGDRYQTAQIREVPLYHGMTHKIKNENSGKNNRQNFSHNRLVAVIST